MSDTRFESRLERHQPMNDSVPAGPAPTTPVPAPGRSEKLRRALAHLERGGVTGSHAYASALRSLARTGVIIRPFHYWSFLGLTAFGFVILSVLVGGGAMIAVAIGHAPLAVRSMIEAGPFVFLGVALVLSVVFAGLHWIKARKIGLPRWRDL
jgi:hypothetical protein